MKTKLSSKNLLSELKKPEYHGILDEFRQQTFAKGSFIFGPSHQEDLVFIVKNGQVRIYLAFEDKDFSLAILKAGDIYATHTRAYATAMADTTVLVMDTARFHGFMATYPIFSRTVISILGELLKQSFSIIDSLVFKDVTQRIVDFLLHEAGHHGIRDDGGILVEIDLTMEQLASVVGSSRQTVSTIVNQLLRSGVLARVSRKSYRIANPEILKGFPHS